MARKHAPYPPLDRSYTDFIQGPVSIVAASRGDGNEPSIARASGCRVGTDGTVTLLFAASQSAALLEAVRASRAIAVVFSRPSTHQTIQLKSTAAAVAGSRAGDAGRVESYVRAFAAEVEPAGFSEAFTRALFWCEPSDLERVSFLPQAAFEQTPGPRAGELLRAP